MSEYGLKKLYVINLGITGFKETWDLQKKLVNCRAESKIPDCLIITEHKPVITIGRSIKKGILPVMREKINEKGIDIVNTERDGDIMFHSPGQIVAYPIIDLNNRGKDLHKYLHDLEDVIKATLNEMDLQSTTRKGLTGVWVKNHKLAAIGVAVSKWVSYHGFSLNVENDLDYANLINPNGISRFPVGSVSSISGKNIKTDYVAKILVEKFSQLFGYQVEFVDNIDNILDKIKVA